MAKRMVVIVTIFMLVLLGIFVGKEYSDSRKREEKIAAANKMAKGYKEELAEIKTEMRQRSKQVKKRERPASAALGFIISSIGDYEKINTLAAERGWNIAAVLENIEEPEAFVEVAPYLTENEIILIVNNKKNDGLMQVTRLMELMNQQDEAKFPYIVVKTEDDKEDYFKTLISAGCRGVMRYREKLDSGLIGEVMPYVPYSIVRKAERLGERIQQFVKQKSDMVLIFDLSALEQGTIMETQFREALDMLQNLAQEGKLQMCSVYEMMEMVIEDEQIYEIEKEEYEKYAEAQKKKIEVLEEQISALYEELGEGK